MTGDIGTRGDNLVSICIKTSESEMIWNYHYCYENHVLLGYAQVDRKNRKMNSVYGRMYVNLVKYLMTDYV